MAGCVNTSMSCVGYCVASITGVRSFMGKGRGKYKVCGVIPKINVAQPQNRNHKKLMSGGQKIREISADIISAKNIIGDVESAVVDSVSISTSSVAYKSAGTRNTTTVSTAPSQVGNESIVWPGFSPTGGQVLTAADSSGQLTWATGLTTSNPLLTVAQRVRVKQNPGVGEFLTITAALASITDASVTKPYIVDVGPGVYTEGGLVVGAYVHVHGLDQDAAVVVPTAGAHTFTLQDSASITNLTISGATTTGFAAICITASGNHRVAAVNLSLVDIGLLVDASGSDIVNCETRDLVGDRVVSDVLLCRTTGASANARLFVDGLHYNNTPTATTERVLHSNGVNSLLVAFGVYVALDVGSTPYGTSVTVQNSGSVRVNSGKFTRVATGLSVPSDGGSPVVTLSGVEFDDVTLHANVANPNTVGYFFGEVENLSLFSIAAAAPFYLSSTNNRIVTVGAKGADFTSVAAAVTYVTNQTPTLNSSWVIEIGPGDYTESNPILVPKYTRLIGSGFQVTRITASDNNANLFELQGSLTNIEDMTTIGPTNASAIFYPGQNVAVSPDVFLFNTLRSLDLTGCRMGIELTNTNGVVAFDISRIASGGLGSPYDGTVQRGCMTVTQTTTNPNHGIQLYLNDLRFAIPPGQAPTGIAPYDAFTCIECFGLTGAPQMLIVCISFALFVLQPASGTVTVGISLENVSLTLPTMVTQNMHQGILVKSSTLPVKLGVGSFNGESNTNDVVIENNNATGTVMVTNGNLAKQDDSVAPNHDVSFLVQGDNTEGVTFTGPINMGSSLTTTTAMLPSIQHSGTTPGLLTGGALSLTGGLGLQVAVGDGYVSGTASGDPTYVAWSSPLTDTMPADADRFVSVTSAGAIQLTSSTPTPYAAITIARVKSDATAIVYVQDIGREALHTPTLLDTTLRDAFGAIVASGMIGSAGTSTFQVTITSGTYFYSTHQYTPSGGTDVTFVPYHHTAGVFVNDAATAQLSAANARRYDDGTNLVALSGGEWVKHAIYLVNDGTFENYLFVYGQTAFASQILAENGALPLNPSFFGQNIAAVSAFVLGDASTNWVTVQDIRPTLSFTAAGVTATTDHGSLAGLLDDDHTQYLLVDGSRAMTGGLDLGSQTVTNSGTINGVTITDMSGRLRPGGADELPTAAAITVTALTNAVGSSTSLARADHQHAHGVQTDTTLHAVATGGGHGFMSSTDKAKLDASTPASTVSTLVQRDGSGSISLDGLVVDGNGTIQLSNSGDTFHVSMQAPAALAADYTLTLPPNDGDASQFLQTNGSGVTSWVTPPGGFTNPMTTAGDVIIRNAGNADARLAIGAITNQVLSVDSTGVPSWKTYGTVQDPGVSTTMTWMDDFVYRPDTTWTVNPTTDRAISFAGVVSNEVGACQITTNSGTTANSMGLVTRNLMRGGLGALTVKVRVLFQNISTPTTNESELMVGLGNPPLSNSASLAITNGVVMFVQNNNQVQLRTAAGGVTTTQTSSPLQTVVANTWYTAEMRVTANGSGTWTSINFLWNGTSVGTISTNLPNAVSQTFRPLFYIRKNTDNSTHTALVDYYYLNYTLTAAR